jgi:hypothetical protein
MGDVEENKELEIKTFFPKSMLVDQNIVVAR